MITQDLGLGMMLWMTQFFPEEHWARVQRERGLAILDRMWIEKGYFAREPYPAGCCFSPITACRWIAGGGRHARPRG